MRALNSANSDPPAANLIMYSAAVGSLNSRFAAAYWIGAVGTAASIASDISSSSDGWVGVGVSSSSGASSSGDEAATE
jgi:hypothetical protein